MANEANWYAVNNADEYDSPALLVFPERVKENIQKLITTIPTDNLRPHVKTNKMAEISGMMMDAGIRKFKTATIAEAEMLATIKAPDVLLAYPPTVPKIKRLIRLIQKFPDTHFSVLVDHIDTARNISAAFTENKLMADVFIDLNVGMNRTGVLPEKALDLYKKILNLPSINVLGLHAYDGHIRDLDIEIRTGKCRTAFLPVEILKADMEILGGKNLILVAGGSPTSYIHAASGNRECSPGTFVFWDKGYADNLPEQPFDYAAVLLTRIISIPAPDLICVDLGYKSVAAESPPPRVYFLNAPEAIPFTHSEEHLVLKVPDAGKFLPGDILYGVPMHICPTVALYDQVQVVENNWIIGFYPVVARQRRISV